MKSKLFLLIPLLFSNPSVHADPKKPKKITDSKSACVVSASGGEYPNFIVSINKKSVFSPVSDGIQDAIFSPSGKFVVLINNIIDGIDVEKNKYDYSIAIVNCKTGKVKGFVLANCPSQPNKMACTNTVSDLKWDANETELTYTFQPGLKKASDKIVQKLDFKLDSLP